MEEENFVVGLGFLESFIVDLQTLFDFLVEGGEVGGGHPFGPGGAHEPLDLFASGVERAIEELELGLFAEDSGEEVAWSVLELGKCEGQNLVLLTDLRFETDRRGESVSSYCECSAVELEPVVRMSGCTVFK